jgi:nitrate reductase gamma subunit
MNLLLFVALPYVAWTLAILGGVLRYRYDRFSWSSVSSQLLESRLLFWGSVPWHYGIIPILLAHLAAAFFPGPAGALLGIPAARVVLEVVGTSLALFALFGLVLLIARRAPPASVPRASTSTMDWILLGVLLVQVASGLAVAVFQRWGSLWYLSTAVPWFWSLARLDPDPAPVAVLPALMQLHFSLGFVVIGLFPFTRLVHVVSVPLTYLWRPYQVVVWSRRPPDWGRKRRARSVGAAAAELPGHEERRRFLNRLTLFLGGVAGLVVALPSAAFLLGLRKVQPTWVTVGKLEAFAPGTTTLVTLADPSPLPWAGVTARTAAWVHHSRSSGQLNAFAVNCTHLGCPVRWLPDAELFMCPCHGGVFYRDGRVASGPPQRPLSVYPVRVRDGIVEILASPLPIA